MTADQNSTPSTLGEFLRQERERRGITIEQVASATKIGVRLLHLLESDQYVELPAKPFIRGFVNAYCRFIGLDSKEVLIRYGEFLEERSHDRPTRDEGHSGYAFERREGEQSRTVLMIVMVAFIIVGGLAFAIIKPSLHRHKNSHAEKLREANPEASASPSATPSAAVSVEIIAVPTTTAVPSILVFSPSPSSSPLAAKLETPTEEATTEVPELLRPLKPEPIVSPSPSLSQSHRPQPSPIPSSLPSPSPSPLASAGSLSLGAAEKPDPLNSGINLKSSEIKYKVVLKTSEDIWVRYQVDDRPKMKFILRAGKVLVLRALQAVRFQSSVPEAISFRLNGGPSRSMVEDPNAAMRGEDVTLFIPKEARETIQDPFPGEKPLLGIFIPEGKAPGPGPTPSQ